MNDKKILVLIIFIFSAFFVADGFFYFNKEVFASGFAGVQTTVKIAICGNNIKEAGEQCDNADLGGASCSSQGFSGGTLSCRASCDFDTSACSSPSGGGSGSYTPLPPVVPQINLAKRSDINQDNSVDVFDFNALMVRWGRTAKNDPADINRDGVVDVFDFNLLMVNWGKTFH